MWLGSWEGLGTKKEGISFFFQLDLLLAPTDLSLEALLDRGDGALGATDLAKHKVETVLLLQDCVGRVARPAGDVLVNVVPQHSLDLLGLEATLDHEPVGAIDGAGGAELGKHVRLHVLHLPAHGFADLRKVDPDGLLRAFAGNL